MRKEIAVALLWLGTRSGIIRKSVSQEKVAFEDKVLREANAEILDGVPFKGSTLSGKLLALREKRGAGAHIHDAALLARTRRGEQLTTDNDVPLDQTPRED